ncbi:MAG: DUF1761 domain-containing protein [Patescibacteria group bacterium]
MEFVLDQLDVNYWAVLVSGIVAMVIGAVWYGSFAKPWMKGAGLTKKDAEKADPSTYFVSFLAFLLAFYVLAHVAALAEVANVTEGILAGLWMWLGFVATVTGINYLYQQKSLQFYAIDTGYILLVFLVAGGIIGGWPV